MVLGAMKMQVKISAHQRPRWRRNLEKLMQSTFKQFARALPALAMVATIACSGGTPVAPDSATSAAPGSSAAGPDGETLKANKPTLVSPTDNVELATVRPSLQIATASAKYANQDFDYEFEIQTSGGATVHKQTVGGTSSTPGDDLQTQSTYRWRARAVLGNSVGPWSDFATFRTIAIPGCINGLLLDPAAYFFYVIGRKPGDRARDWFEVMANSGIPNGPPPGVDPGPEFYGMTQQSGAAGPRGRVFLPALDSDALGYRVSAWDILENSPAGLVWTFKFFDGGGYAPRACP
jgi:hypothetical protein